MSVLGGGGGEGSPDASCKVVEEYLNILSPVVDLPRKDP